MFYSSEILNIKSNSHLGIVWLAATLGPKSNAKRLNRKDLTSISIQETCAFLCAPPEPLSLRLSANLMIGVSRVYGQQCHYHMSDVQGLCTKLTHINSPANPETIDLPNHEKKGTNITLKKIDCISAVNVLPGDPLNFPDLDISNLLMSTAASESINNNRSSLSSVMNPEIGRKSFLLSTPFSTPSSNALQGSDFSSAIGDSVDFGSMNDHEPMDHHHEMFPMRKRVALSDEFNVDSDTLKKKPKRKISRVKRSQLMDHDLMLEKDQLFINESEMLQLKLFGTDDGIDPLVEALKLLNGSDEKLFEFHDIFKCSQLNFTFKIHKKHIDTSRSNDQISNDNNYDFNDYDDGYIPNDMETYRNDLGSVSILSVSTPRNLSLPWSSSASSENRLISSNLNTPIRRGNSSGSLSPLTDNPCNTSPFKLNDFTSNLSNETFDFFFFLQDALNEENTTTFSSILRKTSRPVVARAFHHLLELKTASLIEVKQRCPYSEIEISLK